MIKIKNVFKMIASKIKYCFTDEGTIFCRNLFIWVIMGLLFLVNISISSKIYGEEIDNSFSLEGIEIWEDACAITADESMDVDGNKCVKWATSVPSTNDSVVFKYAQTAETRTLFDKYDWKVILENQNISNYFTLSELLNLDNYKGVTIDSQSYYKSLKNQKLYYQLKEDGSTQSFYEVLQYIPNWVAVNNSFKYISDYKFNENSNTNYFLNNSNDYNKYNSITVNVEFSELFKNYEGWAFGDQLYANYVTDSKYDVNSGKITDNSGTDLYTIRFEYKLQTLGTPYRNKDMNGLIFGEEGFDTTSYIYKDLEANDTAYYIYDETKHSFAKYVINTKEEAKWAEFMGADIKNETVTIPFNSNFETEIRKYYEYEQKVNELQYQYVGNLYNNQALTDDDSTFYLLTGDYAYKNSYIINSPVLSRVDTWNGQTTDWQNGCDYTSSIPGTTTGITCNRVVNGIKQEAEVANTKYDYKADLYGTKEKQVLYNTTNLSTNNYNYTLLQSPTDYNYDIYNATFKVTKGSLKSAFPKTEYGSLSTEVKNNLCSSLKYNMSYCYDASINGYLYNQTITVDNSSFVKKGTSGWTTSTYSYSVVKDKNGNDMSGLYYDLGNGNYYKQGDMTTLSQNYVNEYKANTGYISEGSVWGTSSPSGYTYKDGNQATISNLGKGYYSIDGSQSLYKKESYTYNSSPSYATYSSTLKDYSDSYSTVSHYHDGYTHTYNSANTFDPDSPDFRSGRDYYYVKNEPISVYQIRYFYYAVKVSAERKGCAWGSDCFSQADYYYPLSAYAYIKDIGNGGRICKNNGSSSQKAMCSIPGYKDPTSDSGKITSTNYNGGSSMNGSYAYFKSEPTIVKIADGDYYGGSNKWYIKDGAQIHGINFQKEGVDVGGSTKYWVNLPSNSGGIGAGNVGDFCETYVSYGKVGSKCYTEESEATKYITFLLKKTVSSTGSVEDSWSSESGRIGNTDNYSANSCSPTEGGSFTCYGDRIYNNTIYKYNKYRVGITSYSHTKTITPNSSYINNSNNTYDRNSWIKANSSGGSSYTGSTSCGGYLYCMKSGNNIIYRYDNASSSTTFRKYGIYQKEEKSTEVSAGSQYFSDTKDSYTEKKQICVLSNGSYSLNTSNCSNLKYAEVTRKKVSSSPRYSIKTYNLDKSSTGTGVKTGSTKYGYDINPSSPLTANETSIPWAYNNGSINGNATSCTQSGNTLTCRASNAIYYKKNGGTRTIYKLQEWERAKLKTLNETSINTPKTYSPRCDSTYNDPKNPNFRKQCYEVETKISYQYKLYEFDTAAVVGRTDESGVYYYLYTADNQSNHTTTGGLPLYKKVEMKEQVGSTVDFNDSIKGIPFCDSADFSTSPSKCLKYVSQDKLVKQESYAKKGMQQISTGLFVSNIYDEIVLDRNGKQIGLIEHRPLDDGDSYIENDSSKNVFDYIDWYRHLSNTNSTKTINNSNIEFRFNNGLTSIVNGKTISLTPNTDYVFSIKSTITNANIELGIVLPNSFVLIDGTNVNQTIENITRTKVSNGITTISFRTDDTGEVKISFLKTDDTNGSFVIDWMQIETKTSFENTKQGDNPTYVPYFAHLQNNIAYSKNALLKTEYNYYTYNASKTHWYTQDSTIQDYQDYLGVNVNDYYFGKEIKGKNINLDTVYDKLEISDIEKTIDLSKFDSSQVSGDVCNETNCRFERTGRYIRKLYQYNAVLTIVNDYKGSFFIDVDDEMTYLDKDNATGYLGLYLANNKSDTNHYVNKDGVNYIRETNGHEDEEYREDIIYNYYQLYQDNGSWQKFKQTGVLNQEDLDKFTKDYVAEKVSIIGSLREAKTEGSDFTNVDNNSFSIPKDGTLYVDVMFKETDEEGKITNVLKKTFTNKMNFGYNIKDATGEYYLVFRTGTSKITTPSFNLTYADDEITVSAFVDNGDVVTYSGILVKSSYTNTSRLVVNLTTSSNLITICPNGYYNGMCSSDENTKTKEYGYILNSSDTVLNADGTRTTGEMVFSWYDLTNYKVGSYDVTKYTSNRYKLSSYENSTVWNEYTVFHDVGYWNYLGVKDTTSNDFAYYVYYDGDGHTYGGWYDGKQDFIKNRDNPIPEDLINDAQANTKKYAYDSTWILTQPAYNNVSELKNTYNTNNELYLYKEKQFKYTLKYSSNELRLNNIYKNNNLSSINLQATSVCSSEDGKCSQEEAMKVVATQSVERVRKVTSFYSNTSRLQNYKLYVQPLSSMFRDSNMTSYKTWELRLYNQSNPKISSNFLVEGIEEKDAVDVAEHLMINRGLVSYSYSTVVDYDYECANDFTCIGRTNDDPLRKVEKEYTGVLYDYYTLYGTFDSKTATFIDYYDFLNDVVNVLNAYVEFLGGYEDFEVTNGMDPKFVEFFKSIFGQDKKWISYEYNYSNNFSDKFTDLTTNVKENNLVMLLREKLSKIQANTGGSLDKYMYLFEDGIIEQFFNNTLLPIRLVEVLHTECNDACLGWNQYYTLSVEPLKIGDLYDYDGSDITFRMFAQMSANLSLMNKRWNGTYFVDMDDDITFFDLLRRQWEDYSDADTIAVEEDGIYYIYKKDRVPFYANIVLSESEFDDRISTRFGDNWTAISDLFGGWDGTFKSNGSNGNEAFASALSLGNTIPRYEYGADGSYLGVFNPWSYIVYSSIQDNNYFGDEIEKVRENPTTVLTNQYIIAGNAYKYDELLYQKTSEEKEVCSAIETTLKKNQNNLFADLLPKRKQKFMYGEKSMDFDEMIHYADEHCGYPIASQLSLWYEAYGDDVGSYIDGEGTISNDTYYNINKTGFAINGYYDDLVAFATNNLDSQFLGALLQYAGSTEAGNAIWSAGQTVVNGVKEGWQYVKCGISSLFGNECSRQRTYKSLFYTHHSANTITYGFIAENLFDPATTLPSGDVTKDGVLMISLKTKDIYKSDIYNDNHTGYNFSAEIRSEHVSSSLKTNGIDNTFVIKTFDDDGVDGTNNFLIYVSEIDVTYHAKEKLLSDEINTSTIEYTLYTNSVNGKCSNGYKLSNNRCYLENANMYDNPKTNGSESGHYWKFYNYYITSIDRDKGTIKYKLGDYLISKKKNDKGEEISNVKFVPDPIQVNNLLPNTEYTFELRVRTSMGDFLTETYKNTFTTGTDKVHNPYGDSFVKKNDKFKTDDLGNALSKDTVIFSYKGVDYKNIGWMDEQIIVEAKNAFWKYNADTKSPVRYCSEITDELTRYFCEAIPEKYRTKYHSEGENVMLGLRIEFYDNDKGEKIDTSKVKFALDKGVGETPYIQSNTTYFKSTSLGLEIRDMDKAFGNDFTNWKINNPEKDFIEYILGNDEKTGLKRFNLRVMINNDTFRQYQNIKMRWQGYFAPINNLYYMDYNQNNVWDVNSDTTGFYDLEGKEAGEEFYHTVYAEDAKYKNDIYDYETVRKYYEFRKGDNEYKYILEYKNGKPVLTA